MTPIHHLEDAMLLEIIDESERSQSPQGHWFRLRKI